MRDTGPGRHPARRVVPRDLTERCRLIVGPGPEPNAHSSEPAGAPEFGPLASLKLDSEAQRPLFRVAGQGEFVAIELGQHAIESEPL